VATLAQSLGLRRQISGEERKVRLGILSVFAAKLEDRRLETHAEICCILSDAPKHIDYPEMFSEALDLTFLESSISTLDSKYSAFFSAESGERAMELRGQLRRSVREGCSLKDALASVRPEWLRELRHALVGFEIALRMDLGVYAVEFAEIERGFKRYDRKPQEVPKGGVSGLPANPAAQADGAAAA
jgi:hypothetical protein